MNIIKNSKKNILIIVLIVMVSIVLIVFCAGKNPNIKTENIKELYANETIKLDNIEAGVGGFTCTGATYDTKTNTFYIGDAGKMNFDDESFKATIRQISFDFDSQIKSFDCYKQFENMKDIQGVTLDNHGNIWFCSHGENLVRCISINGEGISEFHIKNPSGIAYSNEDDCFWILTDHNLIETTKEGKIIKKYYLKIDGQDQLYYDVENKELYITAGLDYYGDSFVYVFDLEKDELELRYILHDSFAIEGISIVNKKMYIFNDGLYHEAKEPVNQVKVYYLNP